MLTHCCVGDHELKNVQNVHHQPQMHS